MICPHCGAATDVLETRAWRTRFLKRVRECHNGHRFPTYEITRGVLKHDAHKPANPERLEGIRRTHRIKQFLATHHETKAADVAERFGATRARVYSIMAAMRRAAAAGLPPTARGNHRAKG